MTSTSPIASLLIPNTPSTTPNGTPSALIGASEQSTVGASGTQLDTGALGWLMAWIGEQGIEVEDDGANPEVDAPPVPTQTRVQWLSLLPAMPAVDLPVTPAIPCEGPAIEVAAPLVPESESGVELLVGTEAPDDDEGEVTVPEAGTPVAVSHLNPLPVGQVPVPKPQVESEISTEDPETKPAAAELAPSAKEVGGLISGGAELMQANRLPSVNPNDGRGVLRPGDKGEVVWSADLVVREPEVTQVTGVESSPFVRPQPDAQPTMPHPMEKPAPAKSTLPVPRIAPRDSEEPPESGADEQQAMSAGQHEEKEQSMGTVKEQFPSKDRQEKDREPIAGRGEHVEMKQLENGVRAANFFSEFSAKTNDTGVVRPGPAVEIVTVEPAALLKPAQIATVQVDIPAPGGVDGETPMRLVVSQRGDQVNVRLRAFDSGTGPLEENRMQPLLHSLAEKGFVSEMKPAVRLDEGLPLAVERAQEKPLVLSESAGSQNDSQAFQNANERQQQNQERQQQQQAFFLRKQLKNVQSETFTLPFGAEIHKSGITRGATR